MKIKTCYMKYSIEEVDELFYAANITDKYYCPNLFNKLDINTDQCSEVHTGCTIILHTLKGTRLFIQFYYCLMV